MSENKEWVQFPVSKEVANYIDEKLPDEWLEDRIRSGLGFHSWRAVRLQRRINLWVGYLKQSPKDEAKFSNPEIKTRNEGCTDE